MALDGPPRHRRAHRRDRPAAAGAGASCSTAGWARSAASSRCGPRPTSTPRPSASPPSSTRCWPASTRIYHSQLPAGRGLAQDPARAADQAVRPQVAKQVLVISRDGRDGFTVRELDAAGRPGAAVPWPAWIDPRPSGTSAGGEDAPLPRGLQRTLLDEVPALVVRRGSPHDEWIVVVLDLPRIVDDVLPAMLAGCLEGGVPVNYDVLVNREDVPQQVLYQSGPGLVPEAFADWVSLMPVFGIHSRDLDPVTAQGLMPDAAAHRWRLFIKPRGRLARGGGRRGAAPQPVDRRRRADAAGAQRRRCWCCRCTGSSAPPSSRSSWSPASRTSCARRCRPSPAPARTSPTASSPTPRTPATTAGSSSRRAGGCTRRSPTSCSAAGCRPGPTRCSTCSRRASPT